jgi:hypothetical protein
LIGNTLEEFLGEKFLDEVEHQDCEVYGLTEHFNERHDHYHEHAEIYMAICEPAKEFPKNKRKEFLEKVAEHIGEKGNSDRDLKEKLMGMGIHDFYQDPFAIRCKHLLGKLALENGVHE